MEHNKILDHAVGGGFAGAGVPSSAPGGVTAPSPGQTFGGVVGKSATSATYGSNTASAVAATAASGGGGLTGLVEGAGGYSNIAKTGAETGSQIYGQATAPTIQPGAMVDPALSPTQLRSTFSPAMRMIGGGIRPGIFGTNPYYTPETDLQAGQAGVVG